MTKSKQFVIIMEFTKAAKIEIWMTGHSVPTRIPDTTVENAEYKFINSGLLVSGVEAEKIDFIPNHGIKQVTITP